MIDEGNRNAEGGGEGGGNAEMCWLPINGRWFTSLMVIFKRCLRVWSSGDAGTAPPYSEAIEMQKLVGIDLC